MNVHNMTFMEVREKDTTPICSGFFFLFNLFRKFGYSAIDNPVLQ